MDRDALACELPPAVAQWLDDAHPDTWGAVARDVAVRIGAALLTEDGAAGWDWELFDRLRVDASPAVRAIAAALPRGRRWTPHTVTAPVCAALDLFGSGHEAAVYASLRLRISG